jgi:hypothetical protein
MPLNANDTVSSVAALLRSGSDGSQECDTSVRKFITLSQGFFSSTHVTSK